VAEISDQELADLRQSQQQFQQMQEQLRRERMQSMPVDERARYERELEIEQQAQQLRSERQNLNRAALAIHAKELAFEMGRPVDEFLKYDSIEAQDSAARQAYNSMTPEQLRQHADLIERLNSMGTPADPNAGPAAGGTPGAGTTGAGTTGAGIAGAPGATQVPAGVQSGVQGGAPITPDKSTEIAKRYAGKGDDAVGEYLRDMRQEVPVQDLYFQGGQPAVQSSQPMPGSQPAPVQTTPVS